MFGKLFRNRNRKVVTLSQEALEILGYQEGMELDVVVDLQNRQVLLRPVEKQIDADLARKVANAIRLESSRSASLPPKSRLI